VRRPESSPLSSWILWSREVGPAKSSLHELPFLKMVVEGVAVGLYLFFLLVFRAFRSFLNGVGNLTSCTRETQPFQCSKVIERKNISNQ